MCIIACNTQDLNSVVTGKEGEAMPEFKIITKDSNSIYSSNDLKKNTSTVLMYFSPGCPYCRMEMRRITNHQEQFGNTQFLFVTSHDPKQIKNLKKEFNTDNFSNIIIGFDPHLSVAKYFKAASVPFIAIYGKDKKLKKSFSGAVPVGQLLKELNS